MAVTTSASLMELLSACCASSPRRPTMLLRSIAQRIELFPWASAALAFLSSSACERQLPAGQRMF